MGSSVSGLGHGAGLRSAVVIRIAKTSKRCYQTQHGPWTPLGTKTNFSTHRLGWAACFVGQPSKHPERCVETLEMNVTINPKFRELIPPLAPEELAQLEANILADGCRDPLVTWRGTIVDGHNRYDICTRHHIGYQTIALEFADESEAQVWIIRNQFGRRNLAPFTRVELALKLEPLLKAKAKGGYQARDARQSLQNSAKIKTCNHCGKLYDGDSWDESKNAHGCCPYCFGRLDTRKDLARIAGVSHDTIAKGKLVAEYADEATKKRLRENQISVHRVAKEIKEKQQRDERQKKRVDAAGDKVDSHIIVGDFRKHADKVVDGSVSLIFTDPPYDREASKMLPALAEFAATKLADGGSLVCYVGQTQLPSAMDALRKHLRYWWTIACVHAGRATVMREYGINAGWKAMLWFVKGTRHNNSIMVSDVVSGGEEKDSHDWQQSQGEAEYLISKLTEKDDLICDPFLGGGTTAAAAKKLGRTWIGFEVDEQSARIASSRLK